MITPTTEKISARKHLQHLKDKGEIMVYRIYVEKKREFAHEAASLKSEIVKLLQIDGLEELRIVNRYDVENLDKSLFDYAVGTVFLNPRLTSPLKPWIFL